MSELISFNYEGSTVRTAMIDGQPWLVLADLCKILDLSNPSMVAKHIDEDALSTTEVTDALGRTQTASIVSEAGMYQTVFLSRKPEAKAFRRWVTHEVLPSIRERGGYLTPAKVEEVLADPDTIILLATQLKDARKKAAELEAKAVADAPKVLFADSVAASASSILVGDLAKILKGNGVEIGANRLFAWLRERGYLISRRGSDRNMPTQYAMELGLFEVKETAITHSDGHVTVSKTPKVTGRGQQFFVDKFLGKGRAA